MRVGLLLTLLLCITCCLASRLPGKLDQLPDPPDPACPIRDSTVFLVKLLPQICRAVATTTSVSRIRTLLHDVVGQDVANAVAGGAGVVLGTVTQSSVERLIKWSADKRDEVRSEAKRQVSLDEAAKRLVDDVVAALNEIQKRALYLVTTMEDSGAHDADFMMLGALL